ncbi:MAG TPA: PAS domain-containing protein, partial [Longimicrobiales bacterium]
MSQKDAEGDARLNTALEEAARLAAILESVGEGVQSIGLDGCISYGNAASARMLGYAPGELIGRPAHATIHHTRADGLLYPVEECPILLTLRDGRTRRVTGEVFWRRDGTSLPVDYTISAMRDANGAIVGTTVAFTDVSERETA